MQHRPKMSRRSLPDGWDEMATKEAVSKAYDSMFGEFTDDAGVLKVTPKVVKKVIKESRKRQG